MRSRPSLFKGCEHDIVRKVRGTAEKSVQTISGRKRAAVPVRQNQA